MTKAIKDMTREELLEMMVETQQRAPALDVNIKRYPLMPWHPFFRVLWLIWIGIAAIAVIYVIFVMEPEPVDEWGGPTPNPEYNGSR